MTGDSPKVIMCYNCTFDGLLVLDGDKDLPACATDESSLTDKIPCDNSCVKMIVDLEGKTINIITGKDTFSKQKCDADNATARDNVQEITLRGCYEGFRRAVGQNIKGELHECEDDLCN